MKTKVYVAGASSEIERAEGVIAQLEALGIEVTSTWPKVMRKAAGSGAPAVGANPAHWTRLQRYPVAMQDFAEVDAADILLVLQPGPGKKTEGAFAELGFAKARGKFILWSQGGEAIIASIFAGVADEWLLTDNGAIARVSRYSVGRAMIQNVAHGGGMAGHDEMIMETYFIVVHVVIYIAIAALFMVKPHSKYVIESIITGLFWPIVVVALVVGGIVNAFQEYFIDGKSKD